MTKSPTLESSKSVYEAIKEFASGHTYSPSVRDIAKVTGMSQSVVLYHLRKLREVGLIDYENMMARTARITADWTEKGGK